MPEQAAIRCPACSADLIRVTTDNAQHLQDGYYLDDGDTVGVEETTGPDDDCCLVSSLLVGKCKACGGHYYVVETHVMQGAKDINFEYYTGEREVGSVSYALAAHESIEGVPSSWSVTLYVTPDGPMQVHELGPFKVERIEDVKGEHGVSACQGRGTREPWTGAAEMVNRLRPHFYEIARQQALVKQ